MSKMDELPYGSVWGRHGMVSSCHPLASQAGMEVMSAGGNAVDAAVAMAFATSVLMPDMCGLGGEAFCLVKYQTDKPRAFLGSGVLPRAYDPAQLEAGLTLPVQGPQSISVPGAVELYERLHRRFGRLDWGSVMGPALRLAKDGFPCDRRLYESLVESQPLIAGDPAVARRFYPDGKPLEEGRLVRSDALYQTLLAIRDRGAREFYHGKTAEAIAGTVQSRGGFLSLADLQQHTGEEADPLAISWHGYEIYETPLPTPGVVVLEALAMLEKDPFGPDWRESPELVHRVIEALRLAFQDRRDHLGDPRLVAASAEQLLERSWIERRERLIGPRALTIPTTFQEGDTTSFVAADDTGLTISFIHSLALQFGSGVYVEDGGFFLNNRSGRSFNRIPGHPNEAQPGKRPMHTLNTYLVAKNGRTVLAGNTPGGDGQPQWNVAALLDMLIGGRAPHQAAALPRMKIVPGTDVHTLSQKTVVSMESRFSPEVRADLAERGHTINVVGPFAGDGNVQLIAIKPEGFQGASDPRELGQTLGY